MQLPRYALQYHWYADYVSFFKAARPTAQQDALLRRASSSWPRDSPPRCKKETRGRRLAEKRNFVPSRRKTFAATSVLNQRHSGRL